MRFRASVIFALIAVASLPGFGAPIFVNGGFELPSIGLNAASATISIPNWTIYGSGGQTLLLSNDYVEGPVGNADVLTFHTPYGNQQLDLTGMGYAAGTAVMQRMSLEAGHTYVVTFSVGNMGFGTGSAAYCPDSYVGSCPSSLFSPYEEAARIQFVVNGLELGAQAVNSTIGATDRQVGWQTFTRTFTTTYTGDYDIEFRNKNVSDNYAGLDNVSIAELTGIPEPGTVAMMGCGLVALGLLRNRLRKS